jgi:hypothetical protein
VRLLSGRRAGAAAVAAAALTACGQSPSVDSRAQQRLEEAQEVARTAADDVAELHVRVVRLERRLLGAQSAQRRWKRAAAANDKLLRKSVKAYRASVRELARTSSRAADRADEAARAAQGAARELTVLTRRFNYHLRHHGK